MALIQCYECSKEISDKAPACPHCGVPKAVKRPKPAGAEVSDGQWVSYKPVREGRSWLIAPKGDGWVFNRTFPRRWKAKLALGVWLQGGRASDYFAAARKEDTRRRKATKPQPQPSLQEEASNPHHSRTIEASHTRSAGSGLLAMWALGGLAAFTVFIVAAPLGEKAALVLFIGYLMSRIYDLREDEGLRLEEEQKWILMGLFVVLFLASRWVLTGRPDAGVGLLDVIPLTGIWYVWDRARDDKAGTS